MYCQYMYCLQLIRSVCNSVTLSAGVLCGNCRNGYGVSVLLNKCVTCHDASGILIVVLSEYISVTTQIQCSCMLMCTVCLIFSCRRCGGVYQSTASDKDISNLALPMLVLHTGNNWSRLLTCKRPLTIFQDEMRGQFLEHFVLLCLYFMDYTSCRCFHISHSTFH